MKDLVFASRSHLGRVRENNEDAVGDPHLLARFVGDRHRLLTRGFLFAVADGMGGHDLGEVASRLAIDTLFRVYYASRLEVPEALRNAVVTANAAVFQPRPRAGRSAAFRMGTTLVAAVVYDGELLIANVGDSRGYSLRGGEFEQVTHDHSFVAEEVRRGMLTDEDARVFPYRNVITRAVGVQETVEVDLFRRPWTSSDRLLLCSDGLHGAVRDHTIRDLMACGAPEEAVQKLIEAANAAGGPDNVSVVVAAAA